MFESAELGHVVEKGKYKREVPKLRKQLLDAQYKVLEASRFPVIVLVGGVDGAGKGETVNLLHSWMDPRHIRTHAMGAPSDEEAQRPPMWRFWRALPPKGRLGIFFGSWYTAPIVDRVRGATKNAALEAQVAEIVRFERMLVDEGALIVKFWFHLSKKAQKKRLKSLEAHKSTRWRVSGQDWENFGLYDEYRQTSERVLRETSTAEAPWIVVEGTDERYRSLTVGRELLEAIDERLRDHATNGKKKAAPIEPASLVRAIDGRDVIQSLDLTKKLDDDDYDTALEKWSGRLNLATRDKGFRKRALVCVFEGSDAAGKGGSIRRVTAALDARQYSVVPIAAPTEEERAQPYLWRFWRHMPRHGHVTMFDRSWYGRVLVERVEEFAPPEDWMRAYSEINDFEEQLARGGIVVVKFWLQITKEEQLQRFKERERVGFKRYKITDEDWRNRGKWQKYEEAACDMVDRTSTDVAPWTLVEAVDKNYARIKVLKTVVERLESEL
jgi:polyphosphate:AMP phosphotransferase